MTAARTITTVIAGCDLSTPGDRALDRAVAIAELHRAKVVLVHAQADDAPISEVDNEILKQLGEVSAAVRAVEARELADRMAAIAAKGLAVDVVSRVGPPGEVLAAAAAESKAELIVIGTHGHTGLGRFLLGSTVSSALRHATCDVLVCRDPRAELFKKPLVAMDFSPASAAALERTALVCDPGAPFELVHAWQLPVGSVGATLMGQARFPWSSVRDAVVDGAKEQIDKIVASHADLGHPLHVELVQGAPAPVITQLAEKSGHDLIVVGAHGRRGVRRLLLGSVAESTIHHAPCSVLVVYGGAGAT